MTARFATPPVTTHLVVTVFGLLVAAALLVLTLRRGDAPGAVLAALVFAAPPAPVAGRVPVPGHDLLLVVPAAAVVVTALVWRRLPSGVAQATLGVVSLVVVVQALPVLGWPDKAVGLTAAVVLAGVALLAWRLPGPPGAVLAGAVLVASALASPWFRLTGGLVVSGILDVTAAVVVVEVLLSRHRRLGVVAAATYCVVATAADAVFSFLQAAGLPAESEWSVVGEFGPLVVVGGVAAVLAARGLAWAQAVGAVVLAAGGLATVVLVALASGFEVVPAQYSVEVVMAPIAPTSLPYQLDGWLLVAALAALLALAVVFAVTLARRASAPLAAAVVLVAVMSAQCAALVAVAFDPVQLGVMAVVVLVCGLAVAVFAAGAAVRFRGRPA